MPMTVRQQRVAELLFQELSVLIANELADPRLSMVQVTQVDVSRDLRNVSVYVSHDDDSVSKREMLQGLRNAAPFMRRQIAERGLLRVAPELSFHYDDSPERAARVDTLLRQIAAERTASDHSNTDRSTGGHASPPQAQ
ncbi:MAG: 30S ribosome-binding factor RbfA [Caldilineaceae bacterium]|nr:30S ribosome-binding factor RbfA [Caldilineaceae bacterium]